MEHRRVNLATSEALLKGIDRIVHDGSMEHKTVETTRCSIKGILVKANDNAFDRSQICASLNNTVSVTNAMLVATNAVKAAACEAECQYISSEKAKSMEISEKIKEEDVVCEEKLEKIRLNWKTLMSCNAPQELEWQVSEQCKAFDELIKGKKNLMEIIKGELKAVDEDYHRMFRQQLKDVNALIISMSSHVIDFHHTHMEELSKIECDLLEQRKDLLLRNKAEVDGLLKNVRAKESSLKEDLLKRIESYTKSLDTIRTEDTEDYNLLKVRLETDIQTLQQHLESMAAAYQLNTEKLDYNYAVLVERDHDNYVTAGQQKRKLTKQRDTLCTLKMRHNDYEKRFLMQNAKLTNDYEKIVKLLQDLQNKEHQLQAAQEKEFWEFLHMHHHSLSILASKLLQADKKIHEQLLGWVWHAPPTDVFLSFGSVISSQRKAHARISAPMEETNEQDTDSIPGCLVVHPTKKIERPKITEIGKVWRSYSTLISPKVLHVWAAFVATLLNYHRLLQSRTKVMHEVYTLTQERELLQGVLKHFMTSKGSKRS